MPGVWKRRSGGAWVTEGFGSAAPSTGATESHYDFFGPEPRIADALTQSSTGGYVWPGNALTSSTHTLRFDLGLRTALAATWRLVWTPNDAANGMRLVHADDGPLNITQIAEQTGVATATPRHDAVDVTTQINALISGGVFKHLGHQITAGTTAPLIFMSRLEIVWE